MDTPLRSVGDVLRVAALIMSVPVLPSPVSAQPPPVVDAAGRSIETRPASFRRVASLVPAATEFLVAMGASRMVVARTRYDTAAAVSHALSVGEPLAPSREQLVAVAADLVIAWPRVRDFGRGAALQGLDATVYFVQPETMDGMREMLDGLGRLLKREATADSLGAVLDCQLQGASGAVEGRPESSVAYVIWPEPLFAAGPDSYLDSLLRVAGGRNVFGDAPSRWPQVSLESLAGANPEVILLGSIPEDAPGWGALQGLDVWPSLRAVRSGRVHEVPSALFHRPGPRLGRAASELVRRLHPSAEVPDPESCVPPPSTEATDVGGGRERDVP